jgi:hypothetical protein
MIRGAKLPLDQSSAAALFEGIDHRLGGVLVLAQKNVDVVGHDRAGVAGVPLRRDHLGEGFADLPALFLAKGQQRMSEQKPRLLIEVPHLCGGRLDFLASVMKLAQLGEDVLADRR